MNLKINKENFGDISMAVFYRFSHYPLLANPFSIPISTLGIDTINEYSSSKIMWRGSKEVLGMESFLEYDFKYEIDKSPYSDIILPNYFSDELLELVKKDIESLDRTSTTIFPTLSATTSEYENRFFGSTMINDKTIYILPGEGDSVINNYFYKGIWKVELYENIVDKNNDLPIDIPFIDFELLATIEEAKDAIVSEPVATITFGPSPENSSNNSDLYLKEDFRRDPIYRNPSEEDQKNSDGSNYNKLIQEIDCQKAIMLCIFPGSSSPEINLSYRSWIISKDPNRNMKDYYLRNDRWFSERDSLDIFSNSTLSSNIILDSRNGNLVGNVVEELEKCPILKRKLKSSISKDYNPFREYSIGDTVVYKNENWISLENHNINSNPFLSLSWVKENSIKDVFTNRVNIFTNPSKFGKVIPGNTITIESIDETRTFDIEEEIGYRIRSGKEITNPQLPEGSVKVTEEIIDGKVKRKVIVSHWKDIAGNPVNDLTFNFSNVGTSFLISLIQGDKVFNANNFDMWPSGLGDRTNIFGSDHFYVREGETIILNNQGLFSGIGSDKNVTLVFPQLKRFQPEYATIQFQVGEEINEERIIPIENQNRQWEFGIYTGFSNSEWEVKLVPRQMRMYVDISSDSKEGFEISNPRGTTVYGTTNYNVEFFPISDNPINTIQINVHEDGKGYEEINIPLGGSRIVEDCTISYSYDDDRYLYRINWVGEITNDYTVILK